MNLHTNAEGELLCAWLAGCTRPAVGAALHPVLHAVPICRECAERVGVEWERCRFEVRR